MTLVQNELAVALLGDQTRFEGPSRSLYYRWFTDPEERAHYPADEHARHARSSVADLRAVYGRDRDDTEARELVELLLAESEEVARLWDDHEVAVRRDTHKRVIHPTIGVVELDCQILIAQNQTECLVVFTAAPGSEDAARLELLGVVGNETFAS
ncbi:MAG TPA: hypothetical protein VJL81_17705 [Solirubrobacterales bacterium]|nr:hypothetical protein [Solirubrobacterales bacterium]